jgi:hypothetical protein
MGETKNTFLKLPIIPQKFDKKGLAVVNELLSMGKNRVIIMSFYPI